MVRILIPIVLVCLAFVIYTLITAILATKTGTRTLAKPVWLLLIVLLPPLGAVLWWIFGRPAKDGAAKPDQAAAAAEPALDQTLLAESDARIAQLEARLQELAAEDAADTAGAAKNSGENPGTDTADSKPKDFPDNTSEDDR